MRLVLAPALLICFLLLPSGARAQGAVCAEPVARLVSAQGPVELERGAAVRPVALDDVLCPGDVIRVGPRGRAALALADGGLLRLDQNSTCRVGEGPGGRSLLDLFTGALHFLSRTTRALEINTPFVNAGIQGTEFVLRVLADRAVLAVYEGRVRFANPLGRLLVAGGQAAEAEAGRPPVLLRVVVRPSDAVRWTLHYPPVLRPRAEALPPALAAAATAADRGDLAAAFARLEAVPAAERDATFHGLRAGLLLAVGRAEEAEADVGRALALAPDAAEPLALRAVIAVAQNAPARALADAGGAVERDPDSAAAALALSYAYQARFELDAARAVLRAAVARDPDDALLRARLAELELMLGEVGRASEQAEVAAALAPELGRARTVQGFVALARLDTGAARAAFEAALALAPEDPLPHLGLGLALIRASDLAAGRREIEVAAGLDPNDALLRSYLGKAYFEERRDAAAAAFAIAKQLDPNDPTPWFYDAIRKQLKNRPVEALRDLETAIALNDNRAIYRSRLLLDEDLATRSVSLARIYDDLGFDQRGLVEASRSLSLDPANWSAHRFLSDAYARQPRHEIARVSELLQAQLLQPININPVQPSLAFTDLNIVRGIGPAEGAFNEFHPLFERNRVQLTASGVAGDAEGNEDTFGNELVASGLWDRYSFSAGQFHFQTKGFRPNNDLKTDLYNVFGQVAVTPKLNLQAEYRYRDTRHGDLSLNVDPDDFARENRRSLEQQAGRLGLRYSTTLRQDLLVSAFYVDRDEDLILEDFGISNDVTSREDGYQAEGQYIWQGQTLTLKTGGAVYDIGVKQRFETDFGIGDPIINLADFRRQQERLYAYGTASLPGAVTLTPGVGLDLYEEGAYERDQVTPKLGVQWDILPGLRLRLAYFQTVKPALSVQQTLEPTQIAGFNQFFDDINGTRATSYAIGLDARLASNLYGGGEARLRELDVPRRTIIGGGEGTAIEERQEQLYRAYTYWLVHPRWSVTGEVRYERFDQGFVLDPNPPSDLEMVSVPLALRYFGLHGLFGELVATYIHQDIERPPGSQFAEGSESTVVLDAAVGLRLPERRGILSLEVRNLLGEEFNYQDLNFLSSEVRSAPVVPDRTILGRLTLSF